MKRLFAITSVMLLSFAMFFVVVCTGAGPFATTMKGTWSGIAYNVGQGICPSGSLQFIVTAKGVMTLAGESEWFSEGCLDPATGASEGTAVITTGNGEMLYIEANLQLIPDTPGADFGTWIQEEEIIGGTGRFEGAYGEGTSGGTYKFIGSMAIDVWEGTNEGEINF